MEDHSALLKVFLFLTFSVSLAGPPYAARIADTSRHGLHKTSEVTHTLEYSCTLTILEQFTAVDLLDGEEFMYYDSNTEKMIPKTEWIKEVEPDSRYWQRETQDVEVQEDWLRDKLQALESTNQGGDALQRVYGCEIDDNGVTRGYDKSIYNGKDFISLDLDTGTWTAVDERAKRFTEDWNPGQNPAEYWKDFLKERCIDRLKSYMPYSTKKEEGGSDGGSEGRSDGGSDVGPDGGQTAITAVVILVLVVCHL